MFFLFSTVGLVIVSDGHRTAHFRYGELICCKEPMYNIKMTTHMFGKWDTLDLLYLQGSVLICYAFYLVTKTVLTYFI